MNIKKEILKVLETKQFRWIIIITALVAVISYFFVAFLPYLLAIR